MFCTKCGNKVPDSTQPYGSYDRNLDTGYYYMYGTISPSSFSSYTYSLSYTYTNSSSSSTYAQYSAIMLDILCNAFNSYCDCEGYDLDVYDLGFTSLY